MWSMGRVIVRAYQPTAPYKPLSTWTAWTATQPAGSQTTRAQSHALEERKGATAPQARAQGTGHRAQGTGHRAQGNQKINKKARRKRRAMSS
jgi:hypothetical protein